jgi:hypothetical protein
MRRYVIQIDAYLWAHDDKDAKESIEKELKRIDQSSRVLYDIDLKEIGEQPKGTLDYRKV